MKKFTCTFLVLTLFISLMPLQAFAETGTVEADSNKSMIIKSEKISMGSDSDTQETIKENNEISVTLNGIALTFDQPPVIVNGRTLVPMRAIFEQLGATIEWDGESRTVTAVKDDIMIVMQIDNTDINVNGKVVTLDVPPTIISSRTMVPARAVAESFNAKVDWDAETRTVVIASQKAQNEQMEQIINTGLLDCIGKTLPEVSAKYGKYELKRVQSEQLRDYSFPEYALQFTTDNANGKEIVTAFDCNFEQLFPADITGKTTDEILWGLPLNWLNELDHGDFPAFQYKNSIVIEITLENGTVTKQSRIHAFKIDSGF